MSKVKVICAWCGDEMREKEMGKMAKELEGRPTHGICDPCLVKIFPAIAELIIGDKEVEIPKPEEPG